MNHTPLMVNHHGEVLGALPILPRQVVSDNGIGSVFSGGSVKGFPSGSRSSILVALGSEVCFLLKRRISS